MSELNFFLEYFAYGYDSLNPYLAVFLLAEIVLGVKLRLLFDNNRVVRNKCGISSF